MQQHELQVSNPQLRDRDDSPFFSSGWRRKWRGLNGSDMRRIEMTLAKADVSGIAHDDLKDLGIGTFAAVIETADGEIVGLFSQCANCGIGKSVHSSMQMRDFGLDVSDVARKHHGGLQRIVTPEGQCDSSEDSKWIASHGCETSDRQRACEDSTSDVHS